MSIVQVPVGQTEVIFGAGGLRGLSVENNCWGAQSNGAQGTQTAWFDQNSNRFGWGWDWHGAPAGSVSAYPEVIFGNKPWSQRETLCRVADLRALRVDYAFATEANGEWNAAFEVWLSRTPTGSAASISAEIMVWVARQGMVPAGSPTQSWPQWGLTLHEGQTAHGPIYSFVFDQPQFASFVDWKWFLKQLVQMGRISSTHYVASVEFGNECINGRGRTQVDKFDVIFDYVI